MSLLTLLCIYLLNSKDLIYYFVFSTKNIIIKIKSINLKIYKLYKLYKFISQK